MARDCQGKPLVEGDRVTIEAIVEYAFPVCESDAVEVRLIVPGAKYAPQFVLESAAVRKLEA